MPKTGKMRSVDASHFAMVPRPDVPRSAFDMTHMHKTSFSAGYLVPVYIDEVLPGDSMKVKMTAFCRLAVPIVPVMDNLILESFFFFVPNRLVWDNWERFMGEQDSPGDSTVFLMPYANANAAVTIIASVADYFGITINQDPTGVLQVNALPFRAYVLIWNEWFRDQDIQDPVFFPKGDGPDAPPQIDPLRRGKRHDYFTTCRPWPQKPMNVSILSTMGATSPGGNMIRPQAGAPVTGLGILSGTASSAGPVDIRNSGGRLTTVADHYNSATQDFYMRAEVGSPIPDVRVLVNDIRTSVMVQGMLERNARGGTRYSELIRSHFGVVSPDARLQRPEYLGGGRANISVNPVAQTSATGATGTTTVLGELAGVGSVVATGHGFSQSFTEHGIIIGMVSVRADLTYQNGVNRMWFRRTQFDFYWPGLAHLGEQAVLGKELYALGQPNDDTVFGYQERWAEYKYKPSRISGHLRSQNSTATTLDMWHFAQDFVNQPTLDDFFISEDPPINRVLQVATMRGEQFLFDGMFDVRAVRPMPMYSIPGVGPRL